MPSLHLESSTDKLDLDYVHKFGTGVQVLTGVTGLGLPPVAGQWLEGAGDGATFRGRRILTRDIDLPLLILGRDREHLKQLQSRLSLMLAGPMTLVFLEDTGERWESYVHRIGGGSYVYGIDTTGYREATTVVTVRAGDPYWTSSTRHTKTIGQTAPQGLLSGGSLSGMDVSSAQALGTIEMENPGDAQAYPTWVVTGPGNNFKAVSKKGETLHWTGTLGAGQKLTFDTKKGTVVDGAGANRYAELAPSPRFWAIPPGTTSADVSFQSVDPDKTRITATWHPRSWAVV